MTNATITLNAADALADIYDARRTKFWVIFNTDSGRVTDADGVSRLGAGEALPDAAGIVTLTGIPVPSGATNPTNFQVMVCYDAPAKASNQRDVKRERGDFGWMTVTGDANLKDLEAEQYAPPNYLVGVTGELAGYAADAEAARDAAVDISNISTPDSLVQALVKNTGGAGPLTSAALSASIAAPSPSPAAPTDLWGGNEALSPYYKVTVNGVSKWVHAARVQDAPFEPATVGADFGGNYAFLGFDAPAGQTTSVEIYSTSFNLAGAEVVTRRPGVVTSLVRRANRISLVLTGPAKIVLMPDGSKHPLMLFGDPTEASINPADPNVLYYGAGWHVVGGSGVLTVPAGKTLYLHRDAVLKGTVLVTGASATIRGRGIISGDHLLRDPVNGTPLIDNQGAGTTVEGVTLRGSATFTFPTWKGGSASTISNVKVCGGRMGNDDGISFINAPGSRASDCFVRTDDDCLAVKGSDSTRAAGDVRYDDMTLWGHRARIILVAGESAATSMNDVRLTNAFVIHSDDYYPFMAQPGDGLLLSNLALTDITVRGESQSKLVQLLTDAASGVTTTPGKIDGVTIARLTVTGSGGLYASEFHGSDSTHTVKNVAVTDLIINGAKVTGVGTHLSVGAFTSAITVS